MLNLFRCVVANSCEVQSSAVRHSKALLGGVGYCAVR